MWIYVVIAVIIIIVIYAIVLFNSFSSLDNKVKEAFSTMDIYLKKRWDLVPNLVEVVKSYAKHEKDTLEEITKLRGNTYDDMSNDEKIKTNIKLNRDIDKIMLLVEAYPELKASDNFKDLSDKLVKIEDDIANSRKYYNGTVRIFNNKVEMFPNNIFAKIFSYKSKPMFEAKISEKENVDVKV